MSDSGAASLPRRRQGRSLGSLAGRELRELSRLVDGLPLDDQLKREYVRQRWFASIEWYHWGATAAQRRYNTLRLITVAGGVTIPALISLNLGSDVADSIVQWVTFGLSLAVALSAAVEEFFHYGDRWRHYRQAGEQLKSEGWEFFQQSGAYAGTGIEAGFSLFVQRVEDALRHEVGEYIERIAVERPGKTEATENLTDTAK